MDQNPDQIKMGFTDEKFPAGTHMCLIYSDEKERLELLSKFLDAGIKAGEKTIYAGDDITSLEAFEKWLTDMGVQVPSREANNQLEVLNAEEAYCPDGRFDPEAKLDSWGVLYNKYKAEGYSNLRVSAETKWATKGIPGTERLIEYEAKINDLFRIYPVTAICQYNANVFDGATILNILKVHPQMIVHGQIIQNPYYLSLQEFLEDPLDEIH